MREKNLLFSITSWEIICTEKFWLTQSWENESVWKYFGEVKWERKKANLDHWKAMKYWFCFHFNEFFFLSPGLRWPKSKSSEIYKTMMHLTFLLTWRRPLPSKRGRTRSNHNNKITLLSYCFRLKWIWNHLSLIDVQPILGSSASKQKENMANIYFLRPNNIIWASGFIMYHHYYWIYFLCNVFRLYLQ